MILSKNLPTKIILTLSFIYIATNAAISQSDSAAILQKRAMEVFDNNTLKAASDLKLAMKYAEKANNKSLLGYIYLDFTRCCYASNEPDEELKYALKAREIFTELNDKKGLTISLMRISRARLNSHNYINVLEYLYEARKLAHETKDSLLIEDVYTNLSVAYNWLRIDPTLTGDDRTEKFLRYSDSAIYYCYKCIDILKQLNISDNRLAISYNNLGLFYFDRATYTDKNYNKSLAAHQNSMKIASKLKNYRSLGSSYQEIGKIYFQQKRKSEGINFIKRSIEIADSIGYSPQLEDSYNDLTRFYREMGEMDSAFKYQQKFYSITLKRFASKNSMLLSEMENRFNLKQKETELQLKNKDIESQHVQLKLQNRLIFVFITGLLIIGILAIFFYSQYKKNKQLSRKNILLLKEQNHRVKNNLQVISALLSLQANRIDNSDARKAIEDSQLRVQAMGMIHKKLYGDNVVEIDMKTFIPELVECILPVFGFHNGSVHHLIETTVENLNVDKAVPVGLILNELLTNSCKYAFPKTDKPYFKIALLKNPDNSISLTYQDNGPGFDYEQANKKGSFGLKLIELQSRQIFGEYRWENNTGTHYFLKISI